MCTQTHHPLAFMRLFFFPMDGIGGGNPCRVGRAMKSTFLKIWFRVCCQATRLWRAPRYWAGYMTLPKISTAIVLARTPDLSMYSRSLIHAPAAATVFPSFLAWSQL